VILTPGCDSAGQRERMVTHARPETRALFKEMTAATREYVTALDSIYRREQSQNRQHQGQDTIKMTPRCPH
jgi:hypothetical protein